MLTQEQITHFEVCGFVMAKGLLTDAEVKQLSKAFDKGMKRARKGTEPPKPGEPRQQVGPFFDYDPYGLYWLLDDERIAGGMRQLMGDDMLLTVSDGILHTGGSGWHHDACGPDGFFIGRVAIYLDELGFDSETIAAWQKEGVI